MQFVFPIESCCFPGYGSLSRYCHNFCEQIATPPEIRSKPSRQPRDDARKTNRVGETATNGFNSTIRPDATRGWQPRPSATSLSSRGSASVRSTGQCCLARGHAARRCARCRQRNPPCTDRSSYPGRLLDQVDLVDVFLVNA